MKLSQKELGSILGVSMGSIVSWERGKFKPRKDKVAQLSDLAKKGKEEVQTLLAEKQPRQVEAVPLEAAPMETPEQPKMGRKAKGRRRRTAVSRKKEKA